MKRKSPIADLVKALNADKSYRYSWQANIAMCFYDECRRCKKKYKNLVDIHSISNNSAINFINMLGTKIQYSHRLKK